MHLSLHLAEDEFWVQNRLVSPSQIRRMKDVEFVSELLIGVTHGPQGGSAKVIDEYYTQYEDYDDEFPNQKTITKRFDNTLSVVNKILGDATFSRFRNNRTDFYTLFVAVSNLLLSSVPDTSKVHTALLKFEKDVDNRLADETKNVAERVIKYVRAVEKGANEKKRRADRHSALLEVLSPHFKKK